MFIEVPFKRPLAGAAQDPWGILRRRLDPGLWDKLGNTFGHVFRVTTWGESHGDAVGVVVDGCPPRLPITIDEIQAELDRRRPGQSHITSQRREPDSAQILAGVLDGLTLGTPILIGVWNEDARGRDYEYMRTLLQAKKPEQHTQLGQRLSSESQR